MSHDCNVRNGEADAPISVTILHCLNTEVLGTKLALVVCHVKLDKLRHVFKFPFSQVLAEMSHLEVVGSSNRQESFGRSMVNVIKESFVAFMAEHFSWREEMLFNVEVGWCHEPKCPSRFERFCDILEDQILVLAPVQHTVREHDVIVTSENILSTTFEVADIVSGVFHTSNLQSFRVWVNTNNLQRYIVDSAHQFSIIIGHGKK